MRSGFEPTPPRAKWFTPERNVELDALCESGQLTEQGCAWFKGAIDPFHDYELNLQGLPDETSERSIVMLVQKQQTITKPAGMSAGNWDCHIAVTPFDYLSERGMIESTSIGQVFPGIVNVNSANAAVKDPPAESRVGLITYNSVLSGTQTFTHTPSESYFGALGIANEVKPEGGSSRVFRTIAAGFEVHNDTAELTKQGSVTVYTAPNHVQEQMVAVTNDAIPGSKIQSLGLCQQVLSPPINIAEAKSQTSSRTWSAADGCYVPARQDQITPPRMNQSALVVMESRGTGGKDSFYFGEGSPILEEATTGGGAAEYCDFHLNSLETSGAYFTGLSEETTLTLVMRAYVEIMPYHDRTLVPLATPSAAYDPMALELYSQTLRTLPVGVPVGENAAGDWFKRVGRALKPIVRRVDKVLDSKFTHAALGQVLPSAAVDGIYAARGALKGKKKKPAGKDTRRARGV